MCAQDACKCSEGLEGDGPRRTEPTSAEAIGSRRTGGAQLGSAPEQGRAGGEGGSIGFNSCRLRACCRQGVEKLSAMEAQAKRDWESVSHGVGLPAGVPTPPGRAVCRSGPGHRLVASWQSSRMRQLLQSFEVFGGGRAVGRSCLRPYPGIAAVFRAGSACESCLWIAAGVGARTHQLPGTPFESGGAAKKGSRCFGWKSRAPHRLRLRCRSWCRSFRRRSWSPAAENPRFSPVVSCYAACQ